MPTQAGPSMNIPVSCVRQETACPAGTDRESTLRPRTPRRDALCSAKGVRRAHVPVEPAFESESDSSLLPLQSPSPQSCRYFHCLLCTLSIALDSPHRCQHCMHGSRQSLSTPTRSNFGAIRPSSHVASSPRVPYGGSLGLDPWHPKHWSSCGDGESHSSSAFRARR